MTEKIVDSGLPTILGATEDVSDENKYIIFSLGLELYGVKLLDVREVVEVMMAKTVPNTVSSFRGVCNLRGQIVGVIDLRIQFSINAPPAERPVFFVFETESGAIAAIVDRIDSVSVIDQADVERKPNIVSTIKSEYILGIGKLADRLVTIIDLRTILSQEELVKVEMSKMSLKAS